MTVLFWTSLDGDTFVFHLAQVSQTFQDFFVQGDIFIYPDTSVGVVLRDAFLLKSKAPHIVAIYKFKSATYCGAIKYNRNIILVIYEC